MSKLKRRKRIMTSFKVNEISLVDTPAQEGAQIVLLKRHDKDAEKSMGISDVLTSSEDGHQHGIQIDNWDGEPHIWVSHASGPEGEAHSHDIVRFTDGSLVLSENEGHTHTIDANQVQIALLNTMLGKADQEKPANPGIPADNLGNQPAEDDMAEKNAGDQSAELKKKDDRIAELQAVVDLSAGHRAHYDSLSVSKRRGFLDLSDSDKDLAVDAVEKANPVIHTDSKGREYRKSDDPRLVEMAKERDEDAETMVKYRAEMAYDQFSKQAEDLIGMIPGEKVTKVAVIRQVTGIEDEDQRKAAFKMLEDANKVYRSVMTTKGVSDINSPANNDMLDAAELLDRAVKACMEKEGISKGKATEMVMKTSQGQQLYDASKVERRKLALQG